MDVYIYHHKNINSSPGFGLVVTLFLAFTLVLGLLLLFSLLGALTVEVY